MRERLDVNPYNRERFFDDLRGAAAAIGAPFDAGKVRQSLEVFDAELRRCVVQLKATCRRGDGLYYRFFYKWDRDLTAVAQAAGMIPTGAGPIVAPILTPIMDLQAEVLARFDGATRAGLDFDTGFGLAKVWTFTGGPVPVERLFGLKAMPDAVRRQRSFFERHGLRHVFFVASDHQNESMNVYFGLEPECRSEAWLRRLVAETGGGPPEELYGSMLACLAVSAGVGMTFRWDSPDLGRWCLYGLNLPYLDAAAAKALPPLPPRLEAFRGAPTLNASPQFNAAWSFGSAGFYTKLEKSYAKDADFFLTREMGGDLSHHPARV